MPRRSARLLALQEGGERENITFDAKKEFLPLPKRSRKANSKADVASALNDLEDVEAPPATRRKRTKKIDEDSQGDIDEPTCLGRPRELGILQKSGSKVRYVMGIDEAGRGPLAGPVVAAAVIIPTDLPGIVESKKITFEEEREKLYESIVSSKNVNWAVAFVDATKIDEINILQATLLGMRMAAEAVLSKEPKDRVMVPCTSLRGCYIACGCTDSHGNPCDGRAGRGAGEAYALIDGNRLPKDMPCPSESIVKGDSKEYSIAAASILAKVTRDRLMHAYSELYPPYNLAQHKGYPTAAHMTAIRKHGACAIHRRTFAPLKHMELDEEGRIVTSSEGEVSA